MEGHLIQSIKNWIEIDTEIEGLQKKLKELKLSKKKNRIRLNGYNANQ